jgi:hypothetical protein
MDAYEFYSYDPTKGYRLIGVLPERRENPERITRESVINWAKEMLGYNVDVNEIFFVKVKEYEAGEKMPRSDSDYIPLREFTR